MLWRVYSIHELLGSVYFELLRIGDYKYKLTIQQYCTGAYSIKLQVKDNVD